MRHKEVQLRHFLIETENEAKCLNAASDPKQPQTSNKRLTALMFEYLTNAKYREVIGGQLTLNLTEF